MLCLSHNNNISKSPKSLVIFSSSDLACGLFFAQDRLRMNRQFLCHLSF